MRAQVEMVDPFDLPDWLGTAEVRWTASSTVRGAPRVTGELSGERGEEVLGCDLLAADVAYPEPLLDETWRRQVHQAWEYGQVLLVGYGGRLTVAVPGTAYSADGVLESVSRLARALGAEPERFRVCLRL
ncbi:MAG TPA: hypothetical protein VFX52_15320 [Nocardioidaceae bacterium]|nr:hypothetical protein [Nocardioidaceae bacterium]